MINWLLLFFVNSNTAIWQFYLKDYWTAALFAGLAGGCLAMYRRGK